MECQIKEQEEEDIEKINLTEKKKRQIAFIVVKIVNQKMMIKERALEKVSINLIMD